MHIPDGFLDARTCAGAFCLAGAGLGWAGREVTARWSDQTVPMLGVMSAFVFAGQMVNFPVAGGTSGHLLGGVLAAAFLGPWAAAMVLTTVLAVQCFFFQDGGVTALGANVLNLAIIGTWSGYAVYHLLGRVAKSERGRFAALAVAAWFSVVIASLAAAAELVLSGRVSWKLVVPAMGLTHAVIGVGEAFITVAVVSFVSKVRPDLIHRPGAIAGVTPSRTIVGYGLLASLGVVLLLAPLASAFPDGLEEVAERLGFAGQVAEPMSAPLPDYAVGGVGSSALSTILAGSIGTLLVFGAGWALARLAQRFSRRSREVTPQPDAS
ncbi:MAG: PDGLE domain-containing protein [Verrucomicrobiae bacterium]|nr:PDGLE domain-containing protein [Verrucomicrobiae bacterium]MCP5522590.1 PDGLE domain-containing protein [Verrucomicrobiales bacterium]